jgi:hypothetical protein
MTNPVTDQLNELKKEFQTEEKDLPDGSTFVTLRDFPLPDGWNAKATSVHFLIPVGYPYARPDSFWTDRDLRTAAKDLPENTAVQKPWDDSPEMLWFSWHPTYWDIQRDSLRTFVRVIGSRLKRAT